MTEIIPPSDSSVLSLVAALFCAGLGALGMWLFHRRAAGRTPADARRAASDAANAAWRESLADRISTDVASAARTAGEAALAAMREAEEEAAARRAAFAGSLSEGLAAVLEAQSEALDAKIEAVARDQRAAGAPDDAAAARLVESAATAVEARLAEQLRVSISALSAQVAGAGAAAREELVDAARSAVRAATAASAQRLCDDIRAQIDASLGVERPGSGPAALSVKRDMVASRIVRLRDESG